MVPIEGLLSQALKTGFHKELGFAPPKKQGTGNPYQREIENEIAGAASQRGQA